ncbi:MAG: cupin domain-containing protein [Chloroflexota bacterium]|nr:MAG: cupin domain-containing protein [Chloroflexota bacterium]
MAVFLRSDQIESDLNYEKGLDIRFGINDSAAGSTELTMGYTIIPPGVRNPAHYHPHAEAGFFIVSGRLLVYIGEDREMTEVSAGTFVFVPKGEIHGIENPSHTEPASLVFAYGNVPNKDASGTTFVEQPWVETFSDQT